MSESNKMVEWPELLEGSHEQIYWMIHEYVYVHNTLIGMDTDKANRAAHIHAVKNTHKFYLEQCNEE